MDEELRTPGGASGARPSAVSRRPAGLLPVVFLLAVRAFRRG